MRNKLQQIGSQRRHRFTGTFIRTGYKRFMSSKFEYPRYSPTFLLGDVYVDDQFVTDHLWMNYGVQFVRLGQMHPQDQVAFDARVDSYTKGHYPYKETDYKLSRPTKVTMTASQAEHPTLPEGDKNCLIGYIMEKNADFYIQNGRPYDEYFVRKYRNWEREHKQRSSKSSPDKKASISRTTSSK